MAVSLFTSLALALTWTPDLSQYLYPATANTGQPLAAADAAKNQKKKPSRACWRPKKLRSADSFCKVVNFHERWLRRALDMPGSWLAVLSLVLIALSYVCYRFSGPTCCRQWMKADSSSITSCRRAVRWRRPIAWSPTSRNSARIPEVESTSRRTGLQLGLAAVTEANTGDISVKLKAKRSRGIDEIIAEVRAKIKTARTRAGRRVHPGPAGHDRRSDRRARADRDQAVLAGSGSCSRNWAPKVADAIGKSQGRGGCAERHRQHHQRPGRSVSDQPAVAARAGIHARRSRDDAAAMVEGEPAADAGSQQRSRLHPAGALSRTRTALRSKPCATLC